MQEKATQVSTNAGSQRARALLALREMVLRGEFAAGVRIQEIEIGRRLGVSKPLVLSALDRLREEGLVEWTRGSGYMARHFTVTDIRDAIAARGALEGLAASLAAQRLIDASELAPAREINADLRQTTAATGAQPPTSDEMARYGDLNSAFHTALVDLAKSPMLRWAVERVQSVAFASPAAVVLPADGEGARIAIEQHAAILDAIEARDAARANELTRKHAQFAIQSVESALESEAPLRGTIGLALVGAAGIPPEILDEFPADDDSSSNEKATAERVLDAAAELFCEKGFHATTTRELAARLRIHQASLYHHMASKEDLLYRVCQLAMQAFLNGTPEALNGVEGARPRLRAFIEGHLRAMLDHPQRTLAMVTEFRALSTRHRAEMADLRHAYSQILSGELEAAQNEGVLRRDIPARYIRLALLNYLNWTPRWFHPSGSLSLHELAGIYERVFLEGIASPGQPRLQPLAAKRQRFSRPRRPNRGTLERFIHAAAEMFSEGGYASTSTRAMASLLGMEKATLYYHVESKEDLLYAICKSAMDALNADVDAALEEVASPLERVRALVEAQCVSLLRDQTQHATALAEVRALSAQRLEEIIALRKTYQGRVRGLIEAGQQAGQIRSDIAPRYLGLMLEGLLDRVVVWYQKGGELSPPELGAQLAEIYLFGVGADR